MKDGVEQTVVIFCPHCSKRVKIQFYQPSLAIYVSQAQDQKNEDLR